jgi:hypothetical protein
LATLLIRHSIPICIQEYEKLNIDTPKSAKPTIDYLSKSMEICTEIGYKSKIVKMEREAKEKNLKMICIWEEINFKHKEKFKDHILKEMKIVDPANVLEIANTPNSNEKEFHIFDLVIPEESAFLGKVIININPIINTGKISFYDDKNEKVKSKNLVVKKYGSKTALWN